MLCSGGTVRPASSKYEGLAERRTKLMLSYQAGELTRKDFLVIMGAMSWKQSLHVGGARVTHEAEAQGSHGQAKPRPRRRGPAPSPADTLDDDTRVLSPVQSEDSDAEQNPDLFPQREIRPLRVAQAPAAAEARRKRARTAAALEARQNGDKCVKCTKRFMRRMSTWLKCTGPCGNHFHKKCLGDDRFREPFECYTCLPDPALSPGNFCFLY